MRGQSILLLLVLVAVALDVASAYWPPRPPAPRTTTDKAKLPLTSFCVEHEGICERETITAFTMDERKEFCWGPQHSGSGFPAYYFQQKDNVRRNTKRGLRQQVCEKCFGLNWTGRIPIPGYANKECDLFKRQMGSKLSNFITYCTSLTIAPVGPEAIMCSTNVSLIIDPARECILDGERIRFPSAIGRGTPASDTPETGISTKTPSVEGNSSSTGERGIYCPEGWAGKVSTGYCYRQVFNVTGINAEGECVARGGHAASVHTQEELDFIVEQTMAGNTWPPMDKTDEHNFPLLGYRWNGHDSVWTDGSSYGSLVPAQERDRCLVIRADHLKYEQGSKLFKFVDCYKKYRSVVCKKQGREIYVMKNGGDGCAVRTGKHLALEICQLRRFPVQFPFQNKFATHRRINKTYRMQLKGKKNILNQL